MTKLPIAQLNNSINCSLKSIRVTVYRTKFNYRTRSHISKV